LIQSFQFLEIGEAYKRDGTSVWNVYSDRKLKENVKPLRGALQKVLELQPISFSWINKDIHNDQENAGFLADQFQSVFKNLVGRAPVHGADKELVHGETALTISLDIIPWITSAIQELDKKITTIEKYLKL
jgi:hypothetical protein